MVIASVLVLIVVFSVASIVLSTDEGRNDRPGELPYWIRFGHH